MGSINLNNTGSGSAVTLSSDGSSLLLNGSAIGGGGDPDLYAANESSPAAQPSATGANAVAIGDSAIASGQDSVALSKSLASGRQSFAAALTSNSSSYGAQGYHSVALGERSKATGYGAIALSYGTATADASFAINTQNSGYASAANSFAVGPNCQASANPSIAMGSSSEAKAGASVALGQSAKVISTGNGSTAFGIDSSAAIASKQVFGGRKFSADGDCQSGTTVLKAVTTNATATPFFCGYLGSPGTSIVNKFVMPNNSAYAFHGTIVARQKASEGSACAAWKVEGLIRREANAGTTVLVNSATTVIDNTPSWVMALSADTTNSTNGGGLAITGTGASSTNIRWVANIQTSEITYA